MAAGTLTERVRAALTDRSVRDVSMFGGISFMIDGRMLVATRGDGHLLVRISPEHRDRLLAKPGAAPAMMGDHRSMGDGWLTVSGDELTGRALDEWLGYALDFHASQTRRR